MVDRVEMYLEPASVARFFSRLDWSAHEVHEAISEALYLEAEQVLAKAVRITPVQYGVLRASNIVLPVTRRGTNFTVEFGFGGAASDYAIYVHERPAHHRVGQNKFLERPVNEHAGAFGGSLAAKVRGALLRRGVT